jgi:hypothetical protein
VQLAVDIGKMSHGERLSGWSCRWPLHCVNGHGRRKRISRGVTPA